MCDGKWGCAGRDDELNNPVCNKNLVCLGMYRCKNASQTCIHVGNICDGNKDCPLGDEELCCSLNQYKCPLKCNCFLLVIDCRNASFENMKPEMQPLYLSVFIRDSNISSFQNLNMKLEHVIIAKLP